MGLAVLLIAVGCSDSAESNIDAAWQTGGIHDGAVIDAPVDAASSDAGASDDALGGALDLAAHSDQSTGAVTIYDLQTDFSDVHNPNGVWSFHEGNNPLPHVDSWLGGSAHAGAPAQPAWARDPGTSFGAPNTFIPAFFKNTGFQSWVPTPDWAAVGDVIVHTTDDANGLGAGAASVRWTSPINSTIGVAGGVWMGVLAGRANDWALLLNGLRLAGGSLSSGDGYTRTHPFAFAGGASDGGVPLDHIHVAAGDVLSLQLTKTSRYGYFVDVVETITVTAAE